MPDVLTPAAAPELFAQFKLGRLPRQHTGLPDMASFAVEALTPPPDEVEPPAMSGLTMAMNDHLGCCTISEVTHCDQVWSAITGQAYAYPGDAALQGEYFEQSGGVDSGLVEANVLRKWQAIGIFGYKIAAYAPINVKHTNMVKQAVYRFGLAYSGILVTSADQLAFANKQTWDFTNSPGNFDVLGGHAVAIVGYNAVGPIIYTWGALAQTTWRWWHHAGEECYGILSSEYEEAKIVKGFDIGSLTEAIKALN